MSLPSVWLLYDVSPISVVIQEKRRSFLHLLVRICAVVGGGFAVTGSDRTPSLLEPLIGVSRFVENAVDHFTDREFLPWSLCQ